MKQQSTPKYSLLAAAVVMSLSNSAIAQESPDTANEETVILEQILVTAQKRTQSLKEVPLSVSAISAEKLMQYNIADTAELSSRIGNFHVSEGGQGFNIFMRGLGSGMNQGFEQTVGTFVDGIYRGRSHLMRSGFLDIDRVEVLRGPQSTLFGKNTTAGALNISSAAPTDYFSGYINGDYEFEGREGYSVTTALSNELTDNLQGRVALKVTDKDGWLNNDSLGIKHGGDDSLYARITLAWQPSDNVDVVFRYQRDDGEFLGNNASQVIAEPEILAAGSPFHTAMGNLLNDQTTSQNVPALGEESNLVTIKADHYTLNIDYDIDDMTLTSVTGYQDYTHTNRQDADLTLVPLTYREYGIEDFNQLSQEIRLASNYDNGFNFITGVYYQTSELDYEEAYRVYPVNIVGPREFTTDSDTMSAFAQFDFEINENWSATLGARYSKEDKDGTRALSFTQIGTYTPLIELESFAIPPAFNAQLASATGLLALQGVQLAGVIDASNAPAIAAALQYGALLQAGQVPLPNADNIAMVQGILTNIRTNPQVANITAGQLYLSALSSFNLVTHSIDAERSEEHINPTLNIKYEYDGGMVYAAVSQGTKAGGFDARSNVPKDFEFEDEKVISYEIGGKFTLADGAAELNVALFQMNFEDLQTSVFDGTVGFFVKNGGKSTSTGLELDGRWMMTDSLMLSGSLAWIDFEWDEFTGAKCFQSVGFAQRNNVLADGSCDFKGLTNWLTPEFSGSVNLDYTTEVSDSMELTANLEVVYKSEYYFAADLNPFLEQPAYTKINARIGLADYENGWSVALIGKNLTDETIATFGGDITFAGAGVFASANEAPRSFAIQFGYTFE